VKVPLTYSKIKGLKHIDKVVDINQSPIGRTPRSNPATYCGVFSEIRSLFTLTPEAQIRGYKPGRFSFNVVGGRCETCQGGGMKVIEMNFLPDVYVECESCQGRRFNRETLEIRYKGKSISDVLNMSINEACDFFEALPKIYRKLKMIQDVGLGYITLGQSSTTLSGGEAQRIKLASELSKKDTGKTFYILDEPTTGLHFEDIRVLLDVLNRLVNKGNTVLIIEHNLDVIKQVDHVIDIGPEGGRKGGELLFSGTPEELVKIKTSHTARFLAKELEEQLKNNNFCFMFAQYHHSAMKHVINVRKTLGTRTIFNLLGPLTNPANAKNQLLGVYDKRWLNTHCEVLNELGSNKVMVVHGFDGLDEITLSQNTYICELKNKKITSYNFDPRDIGYEYILLEDIKGGDPKYNAECFMKMINGGYNQFQKIVEINAGAAIFLSGKAINIKEGALIAKKSISEGKTKEFISKITNA